MANDPNVSELGLDTSDAVENVLALSNVINGYVTALKKVAGVSAKFNNDSTTQSITVNQVDASLNKLSATLTAVKGKYVLTGIAAQRATEQISALAQAKAGGQANRLADAKSDASAANTKAMTDSLNAALQGKDVSKAYVQELAKFDRAIAGTVRTAKTAGVSIKELSDLFARFQASGKVSDFSGIERQLVGGFVKATAAAKEFGTTASDASNRLASAEAQRVRNVQKLQGELLKARDLQRQNDAQALAAANRATAGEAVRGGFAAPGLSSASAGEMTAYKAAVNTVVNEFVRGNLTLQQFEALVGRVNAKSGEFAASELGVVRALQAVEAAEAQLGAAAKKEGEDSVSAAKRSSLAQTALRTELDRSRQAYVNQATAQAASARNQGAGAAVGSALSGAFGADLFKASTAEAGRFNLAVNKVASDIAKLKFSPGQLEDVFTRAAAGATRFVGVENDIYQKYLAITNAANAFGNEAKSKADSVANSLLRTQQAAVALAQALDKARQKSLAAGAAQSTNDANIASANALKTALTAAFAPAPGLTASLGETRALDGAIIRLTADVTSGRVTADAYYAALVKMAAGVTTFSNEEGKLVLKLQAVQAAQEAVGNAAEIAGNKAVAAAKRDQDERDRAAASLAKQKAAALADNAKTTGASAIQAQVVAARQLADEFFKFAQIKANPQQLVNFARALSSALDLVRQGKIDVTQFQQALNNLKAGQSFANLPKDLTTLQTRLQATQASLTGTGEAGAKAGNSIHLSFQNVLRIFQSQILFSIFSKIQSGFAGATQAAGDYSKQIALIQTISQDAGISNERWADSIRRVSDALGNPIADTAAAAYDLLSNQVTRGADTITTLRAAIQFGQTTNASATESVNLLSSAINTFGLKAGDAEKVASKFFTVVDLGRVKVPEISNNFARAGTLAQSLGVSLDETGAALSSLTRRGIKSTEAFTLMNNVFLKLIKPTDSLEARIKSWGYETGQSAIEALGFVGVLEKLSEAYGGSTAAAAKDFDELRGARGIISLTGKGLQEFKKDLAEIANSGDKYNIAKGIITESDGQKLQVQFNKIKTFFVTDVGGSFLSAVLAFSDKVGGLAGAVASIVAALKILAVTVATAFAVTKLYAFISFLDTAQRNLFNLIALYEAGARSAQAFGLASAASFGPFVIAAGVAAGALAAIFVLYGDLGPRAAAAAAEVEKANLESAEKMIEANQVFIDKRQQQDEAQLAQAKNAFLQYTAEVQSIYGKLASEMKATGEEIAQDIGNTFNVMKGIISDNIQKLEAQSKHASDEVAKAGESIQNIGNTQTKNRFDWLVQAAKDAKDYDRVLQLVNARVRQLQSESDKAFQEGNRSKGEGLADEIQRTLAAAERLHKQETVYGTRPVFHKGPKVDAPFQGDVDPKDRKKVAGPGYTTNVPTQKQVSVPAFKGNQLNQAQQDAGERLKQNLKDYIAQQAASAAATAKQAAEEQKKFEILKDEFKVLEKFSIYDKKGDIKDQYQGEAGRAKAAQDYATAQEKALAALKASGAALPQQQAQFLAFKEQYAAFLKELNSGA